MMTSVAWNYKPTERRGKAEEIILSSVHTRVHSNA